MALLVLTFVMLLGNLRKIAELIIQKGVDIFIVGKLFLYMIPSLLIYTLPISTLIATLLSLGRMTSDNEITTMRASGIGLSRILAPILTVGLLLSVFMIIINDRIIPYTHFATKKTVIEVGMKNPTAALEPGVFINSFEKYILFIYGIEGNKMQNIRIYEPQDNNKPTRIIIAKRGEFIALPEKNIVKLKLIDGTADEPDPNNPNNFYKLNFKTYFMTLNLTQLQNKDTIEKKPKDMTIKELQASIKKLEQQKIEATPLIIEINQKISLAIACFIFILIGIPLAVITHRREKSINFGIAFLIVGIYYLLLIVSQALAEQGIIPPQIALWLPNIIFGFIGGTLTYKLCVF